MLESDYPLGIARHLSVGLESGRTETGETSCKLLRFSHAFKRQMGIVDFGDGAPRPVTCLHHVVQRLGIRPKFAK